MSKAKSSPLDSASNRLSKAFLRLEKAAAASAAPAVPSLNEQGWMERMEELESDIASLHGENEILREENIRMSNQLQDMQHDYLELQQMTDRMADQLDRKAEQLELMA